MIIFVDEQKHLNFFFTEQINDAHAIASVELRVVDSRTMSMTRLYYSLLLLAVVAAKMVQAATNDKEQPCENGACPTSNDSKDSCGIWLGPSPIKQHEKHGFGFGMFTGKDIPKGTTVESLYMPAGQGEVILPLYGSPTLNDGQHPPLREYLWSEEELPEIPVEHPELWAYLFQPGVGSIVPCTSQNYNLEILGNGKLVVEEDGTAWSDRTSVYVDTTAHRTQDATAGSWAPRHHLQYVAVRDISAGEELTCSCTDDHFDGGNYFLNTFHKTDDASICIDANLKVDESTVDDEYHVGQGLFAKKPLKKDSVIISTPLVPLDRFEMHIEDYDDDPVNPTQLMLNYCYGHPDSDLLWLPYGPLVNYLNHGGSSKANAKLQWHTPLQDPSKLHRRHEHHHPELLQMPAKVVAQTHGKAMTMDIVATRDINEGEEVLIDYGTAWEEAWKKHVKKWSWAVKAGSDHFRFNPDYMTAQEYIEEELEEEPYYTAQELVEDPYPENLEIFCFYSVNQTSDANFHDEVFEDYDCFRPCTILERTSHEDDTTHFRYKVQFSDSENWRIATDCVISDNYTVTDVPHEAIRIVDKPWTTDVFLRTSFRHEIHVPLDMYPKTWMRKKLRTAAFTDPHTGDEFKRKDTTIKTTKGVENKTKAEVK